MSKMTKKYDATVKTGTYQDKQGETKGRYLTIGAVFERDDGSLCMKLDAIPAHNFDGWINFYAPDFKKAKESVEVTRPKATLRDELEDDLPF